MEVTMMERVGDRQEKMEGYCGRIRRIQVCAA
jgi:hypothetical protein